MMVQKVLAGLLIAAAIALFALMAQSVHEKRVAQRETANTAYTCGFHAGIRWARHSHLPALRPECEQFGSIP